MTYVFYTKRFVFKCTEERQRVSCLKFGADGQFFRVIGIAKIGEKYYIIDDNKKEIRLNDTLLGATKKYITDTYGKIENTITRD